jgi:hypothetical protein
LVSLLWTQKQDEFAKLATQDVPPDAEPAAKGKKGKKR